MPPATTPILIVLLIANLTQMVTHSVLVHTGFFREVARIGMGVVAAMTGVRRFRRPRPISISCISSRPMPRSMPAARWRPWC